MDAAKQPGGVLASAAGPIVIGTAVTLAALAFIFLTDSHQYILALLQWVEQRGVLAPLLFIGIDAVAMLFLAPTILFTMGSGFLFGVVAGTAYVVIGTSLGATLAFLLGKSVLRRPLRRRLGKRPQLSQVLDAVEQRGWRVILLSRMVPLFPFKLSNYLFGATGFRLGSFVIGTSLGIIPITVINVYFGSLAASLATLGTAQSTVRGPLAWAVYGGGFVVAVVFAGWISRVAKRQLEQVTHDETGES